MPSNNETLQLQNDHEIRLWCDVIVASGGMRTVTITGKAKEPGSMTPHPPLGVWDAADKAVMELRKRLPPRADDRKRSDYEGPDDETMAALARVTREAVRKLGGM